MEDQKEILTQQFNAYIFMHVALKLNGIVDTHYYSRAMECRLLLKRIIDQEQMTMMKKVA